MPYCAVFGCFSSSRKEPRDFTINKPLTFHNFPANPSIRKKWVHFCGRADKLPKDPRICSLHFEDGKIKNSGFR